MMSNAVIIRIVVVFVVWLNVESLLLSQSRCLKPVRRVHLPLKASLDPASAISVFNDLSHNLQLFFSGGSDDGYVAAQNCLLVTAAISYFMYEGRPRGDARDELLDVRKSLVIKDNLGVFAKSFIAKETVIGHFPGFIRNSGEVLSKKNSDEARRSTKRYLWAISEDKVLDPTNAAGLVDLSLQFLAGLYKVSTTMARINEPPEGGDVNCYVRIEGEGDVAIIAERDIFANEELFIDYGPNFDRSDYPRYQIPPARKETAPRIQPISADNLDARTWQEAIDGVDATVVATDSALVSAKGGGFLSQLARDSKKYARSGILSPEEGPSWLLQQGNRENSSRVGEERGKGKCLEDMRLSGDDVLASLQKQLEDLEAQSEPAQPPDGINKGRVSHISPKAQLDPSESEVQRDRPSPSRETAARIAALEGRLAGMSDAQVEEVFRRLRTSVMDKLQTEVQYRRTQRESTQAPGGGTLTEEVDVQRGKVADLTAGVQDGSTEGTKESLRAELDGVLQDMARDPLRVWQEISSDPQKYLEDSPEEQSSQGP